MMKPRITFLLVSTFVLIAVLASCDTGANSATFDPADFSFNGTWEEPEKTVKDGKYTMTGYEQYTFTNNEYFRNFIITNLEYPPEDFNFKLGINEIEKGTYNFNSSLLNNLVTWIETNGIPEPDKTKTENKIKEGRLIYTFGYKALSRTSMTLIRTNSEGIPYEDSSPEFFYKR